MQYDHLGMEVIHVDFARVSLDEKVKVTVPVELKGTPKGEADGGVLQQIIKELEVECLVTEIPEAIRHNVSEMALNDVVHIKDLKLPTGVKVLQDGDLIVATVKEIIEVVGAGGRGRRRGGAGSDRPQAGRGRGSRWRGAAAGGRKRSDRCVSWSALEIRAVNSSRPGITSAGKRWTNWRPGSVGSEKRMSSTGWRKSKFDGLMLDGSVSIHSGGSEKLLLLKPTTYMNVSGRSVQAAMAFYQLSPADLMVVLDDLALPCGKIRIRPGGSTGGHNGLKDIERVLGTDQYPRLRIGIDAPPPRIPGRDYVLGRFTDEQRKAVEPAIERAATGDFEVDREWN